MDRKITNFITVHHTASSRDRTTIDDIRRWHKRNYGIDKAGYHIVIGHNWEHRERPLLEIGVHSYKQNHESLGIALCGNFNHEQSTEYQINRLRYWLVECKIRYKNAKILGHGDMRLSVTACPGTNLKLILPTILNKPEEFMLEVYKSTKKATCYCFGTDGKKYPVDSMKTLNALGGARINEVPDAKLRSKKTGATINITPGKAKIQRAIDGVQDILL